MNIKNKTYMQDSEFKSRQGSFTFFCREAFEFVIEFAKSCRAGWSSLLAIKPSQQEQLAIDFSDKVVLGGVGGIEKL